MNENKYLNIMRYILDPLNDFRKNTCVRAIVNNGPISLKLKLNFTT